MVYCYNIDWIPLTSIKWNLMKTESIPFRHHSGRGASCRPSIHSVLSLLHSLSFLPLLSISLAYSSFHWHRSSSCLAAATQPHFPLPSFPFTLFQSTSVHSISSLRQCNPWRKPMRQCLRLHLIHALTVFRFHCCLADGIHWVAPFPFVPLTSASLIWFHLISRKPTAQLIHQIHSHCIVPSFPQLRSFISISFQTFT